MAGLNPMLEILALRSRFLAVLRDFFREEGYLEVETPHLMRTVPPDPHIEPLTVYADRKGPFYLHTSPEVYMKRLLAAGAGRVFQICKVFRVEEFREVHNVEFTMLEWYREGSYLQAMEETGRLVARAAERLGVPGGEIFSPPFAVYDLEDLVLEKTGINPFLLERDEFAAALCARGFPGVDKRDGWSDLFFKLFIQEVEPKIPQGRPFFIKDWPDAISTMAKPKGGNKVERFELYLDGLEIANGYTELLDVHEQRRRFDRDGAERAAAGHRVFPVDEEFLCDLASIKGPVAGVSVGVDRLLMALMRKTSIEDVLSQRVTI